MVVRRRVAAVERGPVGHRRVSDCLRARDPVGLRVAAVCEGACRALAVTLRREALDLLQGTRMLELLGARFGSVALVGSVDLDLMTWPDIDIYVRAERAKKARLVDVLSELHAGIEAAGHTLVRAVFNDEWAVPRGDYGSGYYWGLRVRTAGGETWKIDLWGWADADFAAKLAEHAALKAALGNADRELILKLKSEAMVLPEFRKTITSWGIYRFVLGGNGTSLDELRAFCRTAR